MQLKAGIFLALLVATLLLVALYTKSLTKGSQQQIVSLFPSKTKAGDTDSSAQEEKVAALLLEAERDLKLRLTQLQKRCMEMERERATLGKRTPEEESAAQIALDQHAVRLRYLPTQRLLYCENFKVGSSVWAGRLLELARVVPTEPLHLVARLLLPPNCEDQRSRMHDSGGTSLIVVRHPFERLLSAFKDKMDADYNETHED